MTAQGPRVSVVTGATSGIGHALALALARRGDRVVAIGRNPGRLARTAADLAAAGPAPHLTLALDVSQPADMAALRDRLEQIGRADLLIASAVRGRGRASLLPPRTRDLTLADWQEQIDVNLHGVFLANQAVIPLMRAAGAGDIVNIGSSTTPRGLRGTPLAPAYCASKFALATYGHDLAAELGPEGIRVLTLFPGSVDTPLIADMMLDRPFGGRMAPESLATALLGLLDLGHRMELTDPHLLPLPRRTTPSVG